MLQLFKKAFAPKQPVKSVEAIITEIHNEFDGASEKLLKEAKAIISKEISDKGQRLQNVGFISSKAAVEFQEAQNERQGRKELAEKIEYYQTWYPNNKFITEEAVKAICEKYGLVFASANVYKGDVPEKNLREIEAFKLREEDMIKRTNYDDWREYKMYRMQMQALSNAWNRPLDYHDGRTINLNKAPTEIKEYSKKPSFCICAPEKDFDMTHMVKRGYKLEYDPIVLQPVEAGYLVVSKWGIEGSDESLVNEKMN